MMMGSWVLLKLNQENRMMLLALQHRSQKPQCFSLLQQIQKSLVRLQGEFPLLIIWSLVKCQKMTPRG
uniref:Uncharacterized protein n=1 Tax=Helianthus annuus TaxID=4232 RepID=A0A251V371_HELAN